MSDDWRRVPLDAGEEATLRRQLPDLLDVPPGVVARLLVTLDAARAWRHGTPHTHRDDGEIVWLAARASAPGLDVLRPVIEKASAIQQRARRSAISNEDWRYTNGYNDCLAAVLNVLDPEDSLRWVRDPAAEYARLAAAKETP